MRNPNIYAVPGIPYQVRHEEGKKPLLTLIAEAFEVPEEMILSRGLPGSSKRKYTQARQLYFYILRVVKKFNWHQLQALSGTRISTLQYDIEKAKARLEEKQFRIRADMVLAEISKRNVIFPTLVPKIEADVKVIES